MSTTATSTPRSRRVPPSSPCRSGSADRARPRSAASCVTATAGSPASSRPRRSPPVIAAIQAEAQRRGARIPDDHYGASLSYRFGSWDEPAVERAAAAFGRLRAAARPDPRGYFAVGDAAAIRARIAEYEAAGASKFVLRPIAEGDNDVMAQTRRLVEEVLPAVHAPAA